MPSLHQETHNLVHNNSLAKTAAVAAGIATVSNVAAYQANRKLARIQGDTPPALSATTGSTTPQAGQAAGRASSLAHTKYTNGVGKVKGKLYHNKRKGGN